jgi:Uncharacterized protein related to plant photosystem II stability/assembly factor
VFFVDSSLGWVGGNSGIFKTTDGGTTWTSQTLPVAVNITRIVFLSSNIGFAVGSNGTILKTINAGVNWIQKPSNVQRDLQSIYFKDSQHGWICGRDTVLLSTDQGETWSTRSVPTIALWDICFRTSLEGWTVGLYEGCYKSTNGGDTWGSASAPISGRSLFGVCFPTLSRGIVIGGEQIALSTDGGVSWSSVYNSGGSQLNSVSFADSLNGWVVGTDKIVKTTNGGSTWHEQSWPTPYGYLTAVHSPDKQHAWAIGDGIILKTINGGEVTSVNSFSEVIPNRADLCQNYPNPFNPTTIINYRLSEKAFVSLKVYDRLGKEVQTLVNTEQNVGDHSVMFDGRALSSGVYFYRLRTGSFLSTKKFLLLK